MKYTLIEEKLALRFLRAIQTELINDEPDDIEIINAMKIATNILEHEYNNGLD